MPLQPEIRTTPARSPRACCAERILSPRGSGGDPLQLWRSLRPGGEVPLLRGSMRVRDHHRRSQRDGSPGSSSRPFFKSPSEGVLSRQRVTLFLQHSSPRSAVAAGHDFRTPQGIFIST